VPIHAPTVFFFFFKENGNNAKIMQYAIRGGSPSIISCSCLTLNSQDLVTLSAFMSALDRHLLFSLKHPRSALWWWQGRSASTNFTLLLCSLTIRKVRRKKNSCEKFNVNVLIPDLVSKSWKLFIAFWVHSSMSLAEPWGHTLNVLIYTHFTCWDLKWIHFGKHENYPILIDSPKI